MAYDGKVMKQALKHFDEDKQRRAEQAAGRKARLYEQIPELQRIEQELGGTMSRVITGALADGRDPLPAIRVLRDENMELQRRRRELLQANGYAEDYLEEKPLCPRCGDSGYVSGGVCDCLRSYYNREQIRELSRMLDLGTQSFDTFDLEWYSATPHQDFGMSSQERMERNLDVCFRFADRFGPRSENLLLTGKPGLGKTFLSACIARVVSDSGHSVVYDTAGHIFSHMEDVKFGREEDDEGELNRYGKCDLLILDDLGTEMMTAFVQSALYQLVNDRLLSGKKTVISTNLTPKELGDRYGVQILSRLQGEYRILPFFGEDIRKLKRQREKQG